jgi:hypothetical protein
MKIVAEHLVRLPIFPNHPETKIYKVVETSCANTQFYRESWYKGNLIYELVDKELFYEQNSMFSLEV